MLASGILAAAAALNLPGKLAFAEIANRRSSRVPMLAYLYNFHGVSAAGFAERLADRQDYAIARIDRAAFQQLVFRHVQGPFRIARAFELDRIHAPKQRDPPTRLDD